jgi:RHS repeat-associated protein
MFARYYNSATGRFLSPDWSAKVEPVPYAKLGNPQSLNLYSYVYNNPLSKVDPDGHLANCSGDVAQCTKDLQKLAPGTKVAADGTVSKASLLHRIWNHLDGNGAGTSLVSDIVNDPHLTKIRTDPGNPNGGTASRGNVPYDPAGITLPTWGADGNIVNAHLSGTVILGHELIHQDHENKEGGFDMSPATHVFRTGGATYSETAPREELRTVGVYPYAGSGVTERQIENQLGEPQRATYNPSSTWTPLPN